MAIKHLPNFVYIGPDKAGSTWLFRLLSHHADVFMTPAKDLYFFDRFYDRGLDWYAHQFDGATDQRIIGEVSHDYLFDRQAAIRLRNDLSAAKLMVCLREPCERTFSAYLYLLKCGQFSGTFEDALIAHPGIINRSLYGKHLSTYLEHFPRQQIYCAAFGDLQRDPQGFANSVFEALDLPTISLPQKLRDNALPAATSRSVLLTRFVRYAADLVRRWGMPHLVGRIKASPHIQKLLYRRYQADDKPIPLPETVARLRDIFEPDVGLLDKLLGTNMVQRWSYQ